MKIFARGHSLGPCPWHGLESWGFHSYIMWVLCCWCHWAFYAVALSVQDLRSPMWGFPYWQPCPCETLDFCHPSHTFARRHFVAQFWMPIWAWPFLRIYWLLFLPFADSRTYFSPKRWKTIEAKTRSDFPAETKPESELPVGQIAFYGVAFKSFFLVATTGRWSFKYFGGKSFCQADHLRAIRGVNAAFRLVRRIHLGCVGSLACPNWWISIDSDKDIAMILLIVAGAGALSRLYRYRRKPSDSRSLQTWDIPSFEFLAWIITAIIPRVRKFGDCSRLDYCWNYRSTRHDLNVDPNLIGCSSIGAR